MKPVSIRPPLLACAAGLALVAADASAMAASGPASASLGAVISDAIHEGGPFFTPAERAVIEAKCGYAPGEWDGYDVNISNGVFHCSNGKTIDDPQMRALLTTAQPRIKARISAAMNKPQVKAAIRETAAEAARSAIARWRDR